jgi:hypothetical protein
METQQIEIGEEKQSSEAFFSRVLEELNLEGKKLVEMDGDKNVPKEEYKKIQEQAKVVAFLASMKEPANLYAEAVENDNAELQTIMKKYLNI